MVVFGASKSRKERNPGKVKDLLSILGLLSTRDKTFDRVESFKKTTEI